MDVWYPPSLKLMRGMRRPYFGDVEVVGFFVEAEGWIDNSAIKQNGAETLYCRNSRAEKNLGVEVRNYTYDRQSRV